MINIQKETIGQVWKELVKEVSSHGYELADEGRELTDIRVSFNSVKTDFIIEKYGDKNMISNMKKVFFSNEPNELGHSYSELMKGPYGKNDLSDVIELLHERPHCKRATLTFCGNGNGKVPCINVIDFLNRNNKLDIYYFSRGQDVFKTFYADAICISQMQKMVAEKLNLQLGGITSYIASAHIYHDDNQKINDFLTGVVDS